MTRTNDYTITVHDPAGPTRIATPGYLLTEHLGAHDRRKVPEEYRSNRSRMVHDGAIWNIDHAPTGQRACSARTLADARIIAHELQRAAGDILASDNGTKVARELVQRGLHDWLKAVQAESADRKPITRLAAWIDALAA